MEALDDEGRELPNLEAANANALRETIEMIQASIGEHHRIDLQHHIDIRDESGAILFVMHFGDALTVRRGDRVLSRPPAAA